MNIDELINAFADLFNGSEAEKVEVFDNTNGRRIAATYINKPVAMTDVKKIFAHPVNADELNAAKNALRAEGVLKGFKFGWCPRFDGKIDCVIDFILK